MSSLSIFDVYKDNVSGLYSVYEYIPECGDSVKVASFFEKEGAFALMHLLNEHGKLTKLS